MTGLHVKDGASLYPTVKCTNNVQLSSYSNIEPMVVSYEKPSSSTASVEFLINNVMSTDYETPIHPVQSNSNSSNFILEWFP